MYDLLPLLGPCVDVARGRTSPVPDYLEPGMLEEPGVRRRTEMRKIRCCYYRLRGWIEKWGWLPPAEEEGAASLPATLFAARLKVGYEISLPAQSC